MRVRGFTLIEVMVALVVIALSVGSLLTILLSAANNTGYLREKSFAQWIALNRVTEIRLAGSRPGIGVSRDTVEYANQVWSREQQISDLGISGLLRIDVRVGLIGPAGSTRPAAGSEEQTPATMGSAIGFVGTALARPTGLLPDWSPTAPPGPGGGGPFGDSPGGGGPRGGGPGDGPGGGDGDEP